MARRASDPIEMAILGGDLLVSRSLERQLQSVGYAACFLNGSLNGSFTDELDELLEQVRLVIFTPRMSTERRNAFLSIVRGTPQTARMPVGTGYTLRHLTKRARRTSSPSVVAMPHRGV